MARHRTPVISVVLPVHNAVETIHTAVESLEAEYLHAASPGIVEVIAVDDGSTDGSRKLLDGLAVENPWLRVVPQRHLGIVKALNAGIDAARGRYIARMDADDESLPGRLAAQCAFLDANPDIGVVGGLVEFGGDRVASRGYALHVDWLNSLTTPEDIALARFIESPVAHPSVMFRRKLVEQHGGYKSGAFPEDYELWLRWMDAGVRFGRIETPVLCWNDPQGRLSRTDPRYSTDAFYAVKARYLAKWLQRENRHHPEVLAWGSGRTTRIRVSHLQAQGVEVLAWVDVDPRKVDREIHGIPVISPDEIPEPGRCFVLPYVGSRHAREEICTWLERLGFRKGVDFIPAA